MTSFRTFYNLLFLSAMLLLAACQPNEKPATTAIEAAPAAAAESLKALVGTWQMTAFSGNAKAGEANPSAAWVQSGVYYAFFADGRMCRLMGPNYASGQWEALPGQSGIKAQLAGNALPSELKIVSKEGNFLTLEERTGEALATLKFQTTGTPPEDPKRDPFYPDHNHWRIKATAPESDAQLKDRLRNLVAHYICIMEEALRNKQQNVSLHGSPSLIQVFSGGIGIKEKKNLPQEWVNTFYSPAEADRAVKLFTKWLEKVPSRQEATTKDWIQADLNILKRMQDVVW